MVDLYDLSKKRKVVACVTIYKQTNFRRAESASFIKMNVICLMQLGEYPVVMKSYDYEFLKSNSVTNFSQNNAVENYRKNKKKQGSTIIIAWSLIIMEWS